MTLTEITNDLFDIAWRVRAVDDDYRLFYNGEKKRFEVHSAARGTMQFAVPFDELDARTVDYARATRVQNAEKIFAEVERHNELVQRNALSDAVNAVQNIVKECK